MNPIESADFWLEDNLGSGHPVRKLVDQLRAQKAAMLTRLHDIFGLKVHPADALRGLDVNDREPRGPDTQVLMCSKLGVEAEMAANAYVNRSHLTGADFSSQGGCEAFLEGVAWQRERSAEWVKRHVVDHCDDPLKYNYSGERAAEVMLAAEKAGTP